MSNYEGTIEAVTGAIIVNSRGEILLTTGPKWPGVYTIVGGHIEYGEDIEGSLRRELKEEIGVVPERIEFLNVQEGVFPEEFHRKAHFLYLNHVGWVSEEAEARMVLTKEEFSDHKWISPHEALEELPLMKSARAVIETYIKKYHAEEEYVVRVGIGAFVVDDTKQELLLLRRKNVVGHNHWAIPGGHLEVGESFEACAVRELEEEMGLTVDSKNTEVVCVANSIWDKKKVRDGGHPHHVHVGVRVHKWHGSPKNCEPHKCSEVNFFPLAQLPTPLFPATTGVLEKFQKGVFY